MNSIIIKPRDNKEYNFFVELAKRLGVEIQTTEDALEEQLLANMEINKKTGYVSKEEVLKTIQNIPNIKKLKGHPSAYRYRKGIWESIF